MIGNLPLVQKRQLDYEENIFYTSRLITKLWIR